MAVDLGGIDTRTNDIWFKRQTIYSNKGIYGI